jgi:hypothetical protein
VILGIIDVTFKMNVGTKFFEKVSFKKIEPSTANEDILDSEIESSIRVIYPRIDFGRVNLKIPVHIKYLNSFTNYKTTIIECTCKLRSMFNIHLGIGFALGLILSVISANIYLFIYPVVLAYIFFIATKLGVKTQVIKAIRKFDT